MKEAANTKHCNLTKWKMGPLCPEAPLLVEEYDDNTKDGVKERRKEAGTVVLFLSKVSLAKNKASLGRQYTGETGSY